MIQVDDHKYGWVMQDLEDNFMLIKVGDEQPNKSIYAVAKIKRANQKNVFKKGICKYVVTKAAGGAKTVTIQDEEEVTDETALFNVGKIKSGKWILDRKKLFVVDRKMRTNFPAPDDEYLQDLKNQLAGNGDLT